MTAKTAFRSQHLNAEHKVNPIVSTKHYEEGTLAMISESVLVIGLISCGGHFELAEMFAVKNQESVWSPIFETTHGPARHNALRR
jgi:hypothetical protein